MLQVIPSQDADTQEGTAQSAEAPVPTNEAETAVQMVPSAPSAFDSTPVVAPATSQLTQLMANTLGPRSLQQHQAVVLLKVCLGAKQESLAGFEASPAKFFSKSTKKDEVAFVGIGRDALTRLIDFVTEANTVFSVAVTNSPISSQLVSDITDAGQAQFSDSFSNWANVGELDPTSMTATITHTCMITVGCEGLPNLKRLQSFADKTVAAFLLVLSLPFDSLDPATTDNSFLSIMPQVTEVVGNNATVFTKAQISSFNVWMPTESEAHKLCAENELLIVMSFSPNLANA